MGDLELAEETLEALHHQIWSKNRLIHLKPGAALRPGKHFKNPNKIRNLTQEEMEQVFELTKKFNFPATIISSFCGTSFSLKIYSNHGKPVRRLISIESSQFPFNDCRTDDGDKAVYDKMMELVGNQENLEIIKFHKTIERPATFSACCW